MKPIPAGLQRGDKKGKGSLLSVRRGQDNILNLGKVQRKALLFLLPFLHLFPIAWGLGPQYNHLMAQVL